MAESPAPLITYPQPESPQQVEASSSKPAPTQLLQDRLYIGNLHPTVDEYTLIKAFGRFGKIVKLDFLFHKAGPEKGKPRGYAFIEYSSKEEALKAMVGMHDKVVRGRKLVVTFAHQAPPMDDGKSSVRRRTDTSRPTALSILKTQKRPVATTDKIAALEAKLRQMQKSKPSSSTQPSQPSSLPPPPNTLPLRPGHSPNEAARTSRI